MYTKVRSPQPGASALLLAIISCCTMASDCAQNNWFAYRDKQTLPSVDKGFG
jgi:hypothetical protein